MLLVLDTAPAEQSGDAENLSIVMTYVKGVRQRNVLFGGQR
jgi:hypothetical protein